MNMRGNISPISNPMPADSQQPAREVAGSAVRIRFSGVRALLRDGLVIFAFPYAGGPARCFDGLARALPASLCLQAAELPGHGIRIGEVPLSAMKPLAVAAAAAIRETGYSEFVLLGHSFGGSLAFATAQALAATSGPLPRAVVLCGSNPPSRKIAPGTERGMATLAGPWGLPEDPRLRDMYEHTFRPVIEADFTALDGFRAENAEPPAMLDIELIIASAGNDTVAPREDAALWQHHSSKPLRRLDFDGDHFFVQHAPETLAARLAEILAPAGASDLG